ncbi:hypothetical protein EG68_06448 [Paragonimus skrjabini miyazakii]|uniref:Uncharacterized protein n=1 Tax=Paragonimus skrjabini miyazakii TaxID=59628 RepID=A0A8S9YRH9_9TREM|nr:hypothetical protein EG68_06448 [Paragonimus skrjabini miyazakii]
MLTGPRRLVVLPGKDSLSIYFTHIQTFPALPNQTAEQPTTYRGQPGYIYCQYASVPDMSELTHIHLILTTNDSKNTSLASRRLPVTRLTTISPNVSVYDITQKQLGRGYDHLIAECVLQINTSNLDEVDLRRGTSLPPIRKRLSIQIKHSPLVKIFHALSFSHTAEIIHGFALTTSDPVTRTDFELCSLIRLAEGVYDFSLVIGLGSASGQVTVQLYSAEVEAGDWKQQCSLIAMKTVKKPLPAELTDYYQEDDTLEANIKNCSFRCAISSKHWGLVVVVHTEPETVGQALDIISKQLKQWFLDSPTVGSLNNLDRQKTSFAVVRIENTPEAIVSGPTPEEPSPIIFDEGEGLEGDQFSDEEINCG